MKPLTAGSEIDSWCTRCRLDLGHRIVAMVGGKPKRVECQTCGSQHNYRQPKTEGRGVVRAASSTPKAAGSSTPRTTVKAKAEAERVNDWESKIAGQPASAFTRYAIDGKFSDGELISHRKFGDGYVVALREDGKVDIMFRDGVKTLARG